MMSFTYEIAMRISNSFPSSKMVSTFVNQKEHFEIRHNQILLIEIDETGLTCFFPSKYNSVMKWSGILEGGPKEVAGSITRRLADAGFEVFQANGERMRKSTVLIGKHTFCPKCNEMGSIKIFQYGKPKSPRDLAKHQLVGRYVKEGDPQILCTKCDWTGLREDVRFTKKKKKSL